MFDDSILLNKALKELDVLNLDSPIELNVVGGYALILNAIRKVKTQVTDIDYVGVSISTAVKNIAKPIGIKYKLGSDLINNDIMMSGSIIKDLELSVG